MRYWVGNTDKGWFTYLASIAPIEEVNFWQPNRVRPVTLEPGAPWLFKLHVREGGWVVGGAYFAHYTTMTLRFAWRAFGISNGAATESEFRRRIGQYSQHGVDPDATEIGASVLVQPFFLPPDQWIRPPVDWSSNLTRGKTYDTELGEGRRLWQEVLGMLAAFPAGRPSTREAAPEPYGSPILVRPRLGQGAFRVIVTDAYERRCVVTGERTLPVLEAAHIKPYSLVGAHEVTNGLLLRSDLHTLFDLGYVAVDPSDRRLVVSRRIHEDFDNGRDYYALDGRPLREPISPAFLPSREMLDWHVNSVFKG